MKQINPALCKYILYIMLIFCSQIYFVHEKRTNSNLTEVLRRDNCCAVYWLPYSVTKPANTKIVSKLIGSRQNAILAFLYIA